MIRLTLKITFDNKEVIDSVVKTIIASEFDAIKNEIRYGVKEETICREDGTTIQWEIKNEESNA